VESANVVAAAQFGQASRCSVERVLAADKGGRAQFRASQGLSADECRRVLAHIEEGLDGSLPAIQLAGVIRLSSRHFYRAFKVRFGMTLHTYVLQRRIKRAKSLMLAKRQLPLAEIALICGLSDQSHLSRVFRRLVGETPKAWRTRKPIPSTHALTDSCGL
jgi:AraC family transcriptional regulator